MLGKHSVLKAKGSSWLLLFGLFVLNLVGFIGIMLLLQPIWFDIRKFMVWAIGVQFDWFAVFFGITILLTGYGIWLFSSSVKAGLTEGKIRPKIWNVIIPVIVMIGWNLTLYLVFDESGNEIGLIWIELAKVLPWALGVGFILLLLVLLPRVRVFKNWFVTVGMIAAVLFVSAYIANDWGAPRIIAGPYLQAADEDSMTVMWITNKRCVGWVEYGRGQDPDNTVYGVVDGLRIADTTVHKVEIDGLEAGTSYNYRVSAKKIINLFPCNADFGDTVSSDVFTFSTADPAAKSVSFLVFNDLHEKQGLITDLLKADNKAFDFAVFNGDTFNHLDSQAQIAGGFLDECSELFASEVPFVFVRGNHENRGKLARKLHEYIDSVNDQYYYAFTHGPVRFLVLDAGECDPDDYYEYSGLVDFESYRKDVTKWLRAELDSDAYKESRYQIVLSHIPTNEYDPDAADYGYMKYQAEWNRMLTDAGADLMLAGHSHTRSIEEANSEHGFPIISGGGDSYNAENYSVVRVEAGPSGIYSVMIDSRGEKEMETMISAR